MTLPYDITFQAKLDLEDIVLWYTREGGVALGQRFRAAAESSFDDLSEQPGMGRSRTISDPKLHGLRKWNVARPFGTVLIFYRHTDPRIEILRVVHGQRDLDAIFSES